MLSRAGIAVAGFFLVSLVLSLLLTLNQFDAYLTFWETNLSPDGVISQPSDFFIRLHLVLLGMACIVLVLSLRQGAAADVLAIGRRKSYWCLLLVASTFSRKIFGETYLVREDGLLETATAVLALLAAVLLLFNTFATRDRLHRSILLCLCFAFFFFGMEEISWGQRLGGWATPQAWAAANYQQETNLHNLLNPFFAFIFFGFNLFMAVLLLWGKRALGSSRFKRIAPLWPRATMTHVGYVFLFLAPHSVYFGGEVTEQVFAVFGASYAISLSKRERTSSSPIKGLIRRRLLSGSFAPGQLATPNREPG